jgi:general secretion pathway protein G
MNKAFTMIELIFVIVVIGILSAIAVPKFAATRDDAVYTRARSTVGSLRSAIATERQKKILRGDFSDLNGSAVEGLLEYGLGSDWTRSGDTFTFTANNGKTCAFTVSSNKLVKGTCQVSALDDL